MNQKAQSTIDNIACSIAQSISLANELDVQGFENVHSGPLELCPLNLMNFREHNPNLEGISLHQHFQTSSTFTEPIDFDIEELEMQAMIYPHSIENIFLSNTNEDSFDAFCKEPFELHESSQSPVSLSELTRPYLDSLVSGELFQDNNLKITEEAFQDDLRQNSVSELMPEPTDSYPKHNFPIFENRNGTLSWFRVAVEPKAFKSSYFFANFLTRLHLGSNNLDDVLIFKYACYAFNLLNKDDALQEIESEVAKRIQSILATVTSQDLHTKPFYQLFGSTEFHRTTVQLCQRVPLYFLFTSISYLMQNKESEYGELLKPLISSACQLLVISLKTSLKNWAFLKNYLEQKLGIFGAEKMDIKRRILIFDFSTMLFIYNQMEHSANEEVKNLFTQIWETCKARCSHKKQSFLISKDLNLTIPAKLKKKLTAFEQAMCKLYQFKFIELLFNEWKSMESLLENFSQLKSNFDSIFTDFRCKIFGRKDFELLNKALERILCLLEKSSNDELSKASKFIAELGLFINFKCFLFAHDFCNEPKNSISNTIYHETFVTIKENLQIFVQINNLFALKSIPLAVINYTEAELIYCDASLHLRALIETICWLTDHCTVSLNERELIAKELNHLFENFEYFRNQMNYLSANHTRFEYSEFVAELDEILATNNERRIDEIFEDAKYKEIKALWQFVPTDLSKPLTGQFKKRYLEHFKVFLILSNQ